MGQQRKFREAFERNDGLLQAEFAKLDEDDREELSALLWVSFLSFINPFEFQQVLKGALDAVKNERRKDEATRATTL
jgi:hypothetical protein